jgi:hypothetical protein
MAYTSLDKSIWSERFIYGLENSLVFKNAVNTDWEGDAAKSSTVKINTIGAVTIGDYAGSSISIEDVTSTSQDLAIDQKKYFNFKVEDFTKYQYSTSLIDSVMGRAAYAIANTVDGFISQKIVTGSAISSSASILSIGTPAETAASSSAYDMLVTANTKLHVANTPNDGTRFVVISPSFLGKLQKDSRWNTHFQVLSNGFVDGNKVAGLNIYVSNNVPTLSGGEYILAGHKSSVAFAYGLQTIEAYRPDLYFADAVKGLFVYGAKVVQGASLYKQAVSII